VEDLHWSDRATREALAWLACESSPGRWGLVVTHRYEGPLTSAELAAFADLLGHRVTTRVSLEPLSPDQVGELATALGGAPPDDETATRLHRRTGGIPLLVEEVVAAGDTHVPEHLRAVFRARAAAAGPGVVTALHVVAVAGECDELVVAAALGADAAGVAAALGRAVEADLLSVDARGYRFRHDLLREAMYDDAAPGRRRELHGQVARILAARGGADPAVLVDHWSHAGDPAEVVRSGLAAAAEAERVHAPAAAHRHYTKVLGAWPHLDDVMRADCPPYDQVLARAAVAAEGAGAFDAAADLTRQRIEHGAPDVDQALRWERLGRYRWEAGDGHGSSAAYREAVRVLPDDAPSSVRATVVSGLAWHLAVTFERGEARSWADAAVAAVAEVAEPGVLWQVHLADGIARLGTARGHAALEEACRLATAVGAGLQIAIARMWLNFSHQRMGRGGEREANLGVGLRVAAAEGLGSSMEAALRYMLAEYLSETGRWDDAAVELAINLERRHVTGMPALFSWGYLARLAAWRGDAETAGTALARTRELTALAPQQPLPLAAALSGEAERLFWAGRLDESAALAREAVDLGSVTAFDAAEPLAVLCGVEADLAEQVLREDLRAGPGDALLTRLDRLRGEVAPRAGAFLATCEAELSRWRGERDPVPWRTALDAWERAGDPYRAAVARRRLAWALLAHRSGRAEAAVCLADAQAAAARLGARPLGESVVRLASAARLRSDRGEPAPLAALTSREREVLRLVAAGRTNAEIAEHLVISPRTVGTHVSRILAKLGAARRTEAADVARRLGLLEQGGQ